MQHFNILPKQASLDLWGRNNYVGMVVLNTYKHTYSLLCGMETESNPTTTM
jgi:hypothetical protein